MPLVGPRVDSEPMRACRQRDAPETRYTRPWQIAPVSEEGDGIHIDG
jgi:hypothetical protein